MPPGFTVGNTTVTTKGGSIEQPTKMELSQLRRKVRSLEQRAKTAQKLKHRFTSKPGRKFWPNFRMWLINRLSFLKPKPVPRDTTLPRWKRSIDLTLLILSLPFLLPVFLGLALWIKITSRGPVFFKQQRVGLSGERFVFYKFRSMEVNGGSSVHECHLAQLVQSDQPMIKLDILGDPRLIPGAKLIRATGLDELPQLLNVLRGEMSLVGPRPCTTNEYDLYDVKQRKRFEVLPGLTGYWQVKGKNRTTFTQMIEMDEYYVGNRRLRLDLLIILQTPAVLFLQMMDLIEMRVCQTGPAIESNLAQEPVKE